MPPDPPQDPADPPVRRVPLGLLAYCFGLAQRARSELPGLPDFADPQVFIREAARLGASAVQIPFGVRPPEETRAIRASAERLGIALEAIVVLPAADEDTGRFAAELRTLRELGIAIARTVAFPGRRYEDYPAYADYQAAAAKARARIRRAEPLARQHQVRLAIENHKDERMDERVRLLAEFSSETVGACIDVGNNIALLEDPLEVVRALLPWALTVHFKDQGVREYDRGFLLADVPLGEGCIDLQEVIRTIGQAKPRLRFHLELITRDPLKVPVLDDRYWGSLPAVKAPALAAAWHTIKTRASATPFPEVSTLPAAGRVAMERRNLETSFRFAEQNLSFRL